MTEKVHRLWQIKHAIMTLVAEAKRTMGEEDQLDMPTYAPTVGCRCVLDGDVLSFRQIWRNHYDTDVGFDLNISITFKGAE